METEANAEADRHILVGADIRVRKAGPADADILAEADTPVAAATLVDKGIRADEPIQVVVATPVGANTTAGANTMADAATPADAAMIADVDGVTAGIVAVAASASGTIPRLTRTAPAITTSRTTAIPTATTINGATGILRPRVAMSTPTGTNGFR